MSRKDRSKKLFKNVNGKQIYLYDDHPLPLTRRQLLTSGMIGFSGMTVFGSSMSFASRGKRPFLTQSDVPEHIPTLVFDMAGGASIPGNFLVGMPSNNMDINLLSSYSTLGWNPRTESLNTQFGAPMASTSSQILAGIIASTTEEARKNLKMAVICNRSEDDTSRNELSILSALTNLGHTGNYCENGLGFTSNLSGGNSRAIMESFPAKPLVVSSVSDLINSISISGLHLSTMSKPGVIALLDGADALNASQLEVHPEREDLSENMRKQSQMNRDLLDVGQSVDPRYDTVAAGIYGINVNSAPNLEAVVDATISMSVLKGHSGPGVLTLGGCDYHDGTRTTGDARDLAMGTKIGRAIQLAYKLGRPLFFQLITDGGVGADLNTRTWGAESGIRSGTVMGYYNPSTAPELMKWQLGSYTQGQAANTDPFFGASPSSVAGICLANYLNIIGRMDIMPLGLVAPSELDNILCFARTA